MSKDRRARILVIDDANLVRLYYREALENAGFEVDEALNGLEGLEKLLLHPADLVIADINMPRMDGLSFLKILRDHEPTLGSIPCVVVSTEADPQDFAAARTAGANFYLIKPVEPGLLVACATMFCGQSP